ncbi:MAG TPA: hypothetical protein VFI44_01830 [Ornithinibacter sp.]|nr:hypothetical protein [Ornithinibacter sp.]
MRARRGLSVGWTVVGLFAAALVVAVVTTEDSELRPGSRGVDRSAAEGFIDAWERSRQATFVRFGTFERTSDATGATISSEDVLAQRPPRRLHRQLGGAEGRDDRRRISCPAAPTGGDELECTVGPDIGSSYEEDVAEEIAGLHSLLDGDQPVYAVVRAGDGCYDLAQQRVEPRAVFGVEASFCFDPASGAPIDHRVRYAGGVSEVLAVTGLRTTVEDADLEP